jgi:hypothetical protein
MNAIGKRRDCKICLSSDERGPDDLSEEATSATWLIDPDSSLA